MTKILQIEDCSAASAWSPIKEYGNIIALGAKDSGGVGFEETKGKLELYDLNLAHHGSQEESSKLMGTVETESRFSALAWTPGTAGGKYPMGLLAGGMENGTVHVWSPVAIIEGVDSLVATFTDHASGPVEALAFNSLMPLQLATGGSDGKVLIFSLDQKGGAAVTPCDTTQQRSRITAVAWNSQVAHILASAAADGTVVVWDIKSRKAWCELRGETTGQAVSDIAWNPTQGLHLLTASADDHNPVIKLWDLRASTSMPLTTLSGHTQGILRMAWCPHDDHLLLSCAKDSRTILWDLFSLSPIADVPNDSHKDQTEQSNGGNEMFAASGLSSSKQMRYEVQWSPIKRGVISTCSLDRKVQAHSILGLSSKAGRPPKWMRPASSVSFGFGGSLVTSGVADKIVRLRNVVEEKKLVEVATSFESAFETTEVIDYCISRASSTTDAVDAQVWAFMQVIFAPNARQQLLDNLGYDPNAIAEAARSFVDAGDNSPQQGIATSTGAMSPATEDLVKKALLVGNFEAAVECCFKAGNLADALILASCGGPDLWSKAQQRYFETQSSSKPYLSTVNAIIHNQLEALVKESDPKSWPETLAILSTYGKSDEFPQLCIALGDLLQSGGDLQSASLCYMCSLSLEKSVHFWRTQLNEANEKMGSLDVLALHDFVVRVSVFLGALGNQASLEPLDAQSFSAYAEKLAAQGLLRSAAKYCKGDNLETLVLRDRLYRSRASQGCLEAMNNQAPNFPFNFVEIQPSRIPTVDRAYVRQQEAAAMSSQAHSATTSATTEGMASATTGPETSSSVLPSGWVAIQDPASGHYYYANQSTGEVTWEKPLSAQPSPAPVQQPAAAPAVQATPQEQPQPTEASQQRTSTPSRTSKLASKYGDGFVTSSSHPELASQYGNVGTSNPYATSSRPGTAQVGSSVSEKAPVSANLDPNRIPELRAEYQPIKDCLISLIEALKNIQLTSVDKRLLAEAEKATAVLLKRLARAEVSDDIGGKVVTMCSYVNSYDFKSAQSVHTNLVNSDWREHKEWLKGTKSLLQLATKKFSQ